MGKVGKGKEKKEREGKGIEEKRGKRREKRG